MLKNKIQQDIIEAMKGGQKEKLEVLRYLGAQIQNAEIERGKKELTDEEIIKLLSSQIKKLQESLALFEKGRRLDLLDKTKKEIAVLAAYLPSQLNDEALEAEITKIIQQNPSIKHPGSLIGLCLKTLTGRADGAKIAQIIRQKLA